MKLMKARPQRILCVCVGNSDRSPVMAAVLRQFLLTAGHETMVESAGTNDNSAKGGKAGLHATQAALVLGLDISDHNKRRIDKLDLNSYDLIICVDDKIAGELYTTRGVPLANLYNASISNPWPCQFQEEYDKTMEQILIMAYKILKFYFS